MVVNKKKFINNISLSNNVSLLESFVSSGQRALVLDRNLDIANIAVKDFYHLVILETADALVSVPIPDIICYKSDSAYLNFALVYDQLFVNIDSLLVSNFNAVSMFSKLHRTVDQYNVNYLPSESSSAITTSAAIVNQINCGLNMLAPGVHLAKLMGIDTIYYSGVSASATTVTAADILSFTTAATRLSLANLIKPNRQPILKTSF